MEARSLDFLTEPGTRDFVLRIIEFKASTPKNAAPKLDRAKEKVGGLSGTR
jgi:hypothetical protein